ncbi:hypothetical protein SELMODRAFT_132544 [Selaginella moellendorffii]|uniref:Thylakoid membrane protein slr0575 n=1 Tax=Selaginella moellendorffii TaxID=88036 RepID=D8T5S7_SELML|nr:hypothetical protein SELMODRAFT_132544 [Selaginella moellendorffii]
MAAIGRACGFPPVGLAAPISRRNSAHWIVTRSGNGAAIRRVIVRAAGVDLDAAAPAASSGTKSKEIAPDNSWSITKTSFGTIGLFLGSGLLSYGFGAYFTILPGSEWSSLMLTYGFPLAIIGMALKYAELKPVPCTTYADALALRESQATPILKQVREDVIRYRYGDEQHLEEALKRIFRYGQGGGIQARNGPVLQSIREEVSDQGKYTLVLVFKAKALQLEDFLTRQAKFTSFFGPGVTANIGRSFLVFLKVFNPSLLSQNRPAIASSK